MFPTVSVRFANHSAADEVFRLLTADPLIQVLATKATVTSRKGQLAHLSASDLYIFSRETDSFVPLNNWLYERHLIDWVSIVGEKCVHLLRTSISRR